MENFNLLHYFQRSWSETLANGTFNTEKSLKLESDYILLDEKLTNYDSGIDTTDNDGNSSDEAGVNSDGGYVDDFNDDTSVYLSETRQCAEDISSSQTCNLFKPVVVLDYFNHHDENKGGFIVNRENISEKDGFPVMAGAVLNIGNNYPKGTPEMVQFIEDTPSDDVILRVNEKDDNYGEICNEISNNIAVCISENRHCKEDITSSQTINYLEPVVVLDYFNHHDENKGGFIVNRENISEKDGFPVMAGAVLNIGNNYPKGTPEMVQFIEDTPSDDVILRVNEKDDNYGEICNEISNNIAVCISENRHCKEDIISSQTINY